MAIECKYERMQDKKYSMFSANKFKTFFTKLKEIFYSNIVTYFEISGSIMEGDFVVECKLLRGRGGSKIKILLHEIYITEPHEIILTPEECGYFNFEVWSLEVTGQNLLYV